MPVSTRQATPGPSTLAQTASQPSNQSKNTKKRANSDAQEDGREVKKKIKIGTEGPPHATNGKEKKKKKKKKKRRTSVVIPDPETEEQTRPARRSVPLSSSGQAVTPSGDSAPNSRTANHVRENEENEEPVLSSSDKGKGKALSESPSRRAAKSPPAQPIASGSGSAAVSPTDSTPHDSEIARLKEQLAAQSKLLERHQNHLGHHHQSLTCQICLELMYKPYALAPCGHITCYGCLVRWFTAPLNPVVAVPEMNGAEPAPQVPDTIEAILNSDPARNGSYVRRRKKCPVCRAVVVERPVEMWGIKDMVSALVRSNLVDIPSAPAPPAAEEGANADPWRNVFRRAGAAHGGPFAAFFPFAAPAPREQGDDDREQMGWYDAEDGGIHRCIDCYHEIWDGICSGCQREYPGHGLHNDDDEDDDDDGSDIADFLPFGHRMDIFASDGESDDHEDVEDAFGYLLDQGGYAEGWGIDGEPSEDDYEDEDEEMELQDPLANLPQFIPARPGRWPRERSVARIVEVDNEEDEEDGESDYGGSFIDDDENGDGEDHGDDEDGEDHDEVEFVEPPRLRVRLPARRRRGEEGQRRYEEISDDDDDEEEEQGKLFEPRPEPVDDDSDNDSADDEDRHGSRRHVHHRLIVDESDSDGDGSHVDDDNDDDEDMGPPPFHARYARRIFPVVDWHEEDDDDEEEDNGW